jgi:2-dehydropantoate 2-reductase
MNQPPHSWPRSVAVIGPGAIGLAIASRLFERGLAPLLCGRSPFDTLRVDHTSRPPWRRDAVAPLLDAAEASGLGAQQLVFLCTKAHQTAAAAPWLRSLCGAQSLLVVVQNGVEHEQRVRAALQLEAGQPLPCQLLPAVIDLPATRPTPGHSVLRRDGLALVPAGEAGRGLVALFGDDPVVRWATADDLLSAKWRKLCTNVISGAIPALTDQPGGVFRLPAIGELARAAVTECVLVGRAEGAELPDGLVDEIVSGFAQGPRDGLNSMLQDRRAGRALEADARNGAVVRYGARHGIATPVNQALAALTSAVNVDVLAG